MKFRADYKHLWESLVRILYTIFHKQYVNLQGIITMVRQMKRTYGLHMFTHCIKESPCNIFMVTESSFSHSRLVLWQCAFFLSCSSAYTWLHLSWVLLQPKLQWRRQQELAWRLENTILAHWRNVPTTSRFTKLSVRCTY